MSRQTHAFLSLIGLPALVAKDEKDYFQIVEKLAADPGQLQMLRISLRDRMKQSPLCDVERFSKDWTSILQEIAEAQKRPGLLIGDQAAAGTPG